MNESDLKFNLLSHPFYDSWTKGLLTLDQLSNYGYSYLEFIKNIPHYWLKTVNSFKIEGFESRKVVEDELRHIILWNKWISKLPQPEDDSGLDLLLDSFETLDPSELLGAVVAFEIQQPRIAETKKLGLQKFYGFEEEDLLYFDEHLNEKEHIEFGNRVRIKADIAQFKKGFDLSAELHYTSLNQFLS